MLITSFKLQKQHFHILLCSQRSKGPDTTNQHQRNSGIDSWLLCGLTLPVPTSCTWTHHRDYSQQPTVVVVQKGKLEDSGLQTNHSDKPAFFWHHSFWNLGGCSSGVKAGYLVRLLVGLPVPPSCMSKCPWARYWTPNCSWWAVDILHGSLRHQWMNVCVNWRMWQVL